MIVLNRITNYHAPDNSCSPRAGRKEFIIHHVPDKSSSFINNVLLFQPTTTIKIHFIIIKDSEPKRKTLLVIDDHVLVTIYSTTPSRLQRSLFISHEKLDHLGLWIENTICQRCRQKNQFRATTQGRWLKAKDLYVRTKRHKKLKSRQVCVNLKDPTGSPTRFDFRKERKNKSNSVETSDAFLLIV